MTSFEVAQKLNRINGSHPLTLVAEVETRRLLREVITLGIYTIEPRAAEAIKHALEEVETLSAPIMPTSDFETVAYADELDDLTCIADCRTIDKRDLRLTAGKKYPHTTGSYRFTENFERNKVHFNESTGETYTKTHQCVLSGSDRYIQILDDNGNIIRFMDRPRKNYVSEFDEKLLWDYFKKPVVNTVAEACKAQVEQNIAVLNALEMAAGYKYFPGQKEYLSRIAVKDHALAAADTGVGKSLCAISLIAMKSPQRALIVAPQGAIRASESEDEEDESGMDASQWVKELTRFAPYLQVFEIFSLEDYERICAMNDGELPSGCVYVTYYECLFSNGAREVLPESWDDFKFNKWAKSMGLAELPVAAGAGGIVVDKRLNCNTVGMEKNGIRCIIEPCLATLIGDKFDAVLLDESHRLKNQLTVGGQMMIRLQPKFRYAFTATPIPNTVNDIFSIMGWLAVPGWYKGKVLNAAFPYAREDLQRFTSTFLSMERDLTQEDDNRRRAEKEGKKWSGACVKDSPIISSPARLLKILKPTMGFISKEQCYDKYIPPKIVDVRVPMGKEQTVLYGYFLDRANIPATNPLVRARKQTAWLRNICADPAGFRHGGPKVYSNMNPKVIAILELTRDILAKGEQVIIINSRIGLTSTLHEKLCESGVSIARIDSTLPADQHSAQANLFKSGKAQVLLLGIKCAAAYSFDDCKNLIIGSLEYAFGNYHQAIGRIDRITNKTVKNIWCVLHKNSLEELMWEVVALKGDAATICLRGQRVPRTFIPVDASEVLAKAIERFSLDGSVAESNCEKEWPKLREKIILANKR